MCSVDNYIVTRFHFFLKTFSIFIKVEFVFFARYVGEKPKRASERECNILHRISIGHTMPRFSSETTVRRCISSEIRRAIIPGKLIDILDHAMAAATRGILYDRERGGYMVAVRNIFIPNSLPSPTRLQSEVQISYLRDGRCHPRDTV